jgi:hypothetical protein
MWTTQKRCPHTHRQQPRVLVSSMTSMSMSTCGPSTRRLAQSEALYVDRASAATARSGSKCGRGLAADSSIADLFAPEDPRRFDLEHQTLAKLRRTMRHLRIEYVAGSSTGLFEQADVHYGEIWYDLGGIRAVGRSATTEGVLDAIYELAGMQPPQEGEAGHRGHPLAAEPAGAAALFYVIWPLTVLGLGLLLHRRRLT